MSRKEADIGQAPDGDDRQVEVPALAGMAQEVGNPTEDALPVAGACCRYGDCLLKRIAVHGAVTFLRSVAVRSTVFGVGPATAFEDDQATAFARQFLEGERQALDEGAVHER